MKHHQTALAIILVLIISFQPTLAYAKPSISTLLSNIDEETLKHFFYDGLLFRNIFFKLYFLIEDKPSQDIVDEYIIHLIWRVENKGGYSEEYEAVKEIDELYNKGYITSSHVPILRKLESHIRNAKLRNYIYTLVRVLSRSSPPQSQVESETGGKSETQPTSGTQTHTQTTSGSQQSPTSSHSGREQSPSLEDSYKSKPSRTEGWEYVYETPHYKIYYNLTHGYTVSEYTVELIADALEKSWNLYVQVGFSPPSGEFPVYLCTSPNRGKGATSPSRMYIDARKGDVVRVAVHENFHHFQFVYGMGNPIYGLFVIEGTAEAMTYYYLLKYTSYDPNSQMGYTTNKMFNSPDKCIWKRTYDAFPFWEYILYKDRSLFIKAVKIAMGGSYSSSKELFFKIFGGQADEIIVDFYISIGKGKAYPKQKRVYMEQVSYYRSIGGLVSPYGADYYRITVAGVINITAPSYVKAYIITPSGETKEFRSDTSISANSIVVVVNIGDDRSSYTIYLKS